MSQALSGPLPVHGNHSAEGFMFKAVLGRDCRITLELASGHAFCSFLVFGMENGLAVL